MTTLLALLLTLLAVTGGSPANMIWWAGDGTGGEEGLAPLAAVNEPSEGGAGGRKRRLELEPNPEEEPETKLGARTETGRDSGSRLGSQTGTGTSTNFNSGTVAGNVGAGGGVGEGARIGGEECDGAGTLCVPYYQCEGGRVITDGTGLIDIRVGDEVITPHSKCERYLDVCCLGPDYGLPPYPPLVDPHEPGCGLRNTQGVHANIVSGFNVTQTQFGEFPWMVAILRIETIGGQDVNLYLCGGSLIQPNMVLTAAHCVNGFGVETLKVRAGEWDTQSEYELYPHQDRLVKHVKLHSQFKAASLWNDYAVLILDSPLVLAPNVDTICLPGPRESFDHVTCFATGWGKDKFGDGGRFQNILKQVAVQIVPHRVCETTLKNTRLGEHFHLHGSFLCAGGEHGVDTCKGDGGSPLVCARPTSGSTRPKYFQAGIVAWGIGCGEDGIPGVYADLTKVVQWVSDLVRQYLIA